MTYNEKKSLYESIMKEVAKTVKRKINENIVIKDDYIFNYYIDEQGDIKVKFGIKSTSEEESMFFYTAFIQATLVNFNDLFIEIPAGKNNKIYKDWMNNCDEDTHNRLDDMIEKIYKTCFKSATNGYTLAKKMKKAAPSLGFEFIYKLIED